MSKDRDTLLSSAVRRQIVDLIEAEPGRWTALTLADELGLHVTTVRFHLDQLEQAGVVGSEPERRDRPGRPRKVYRRAVEATPVSSTAYVILADVLSATLSEVDDPHARAVAADRAGVRWVAAHASAVAPGADAPRGETSRGTTPATGAQTAPAGESGPGSRPAATSPAAAGGPPERAHIVSDVPGADPVPVDRAYADAVPATHDADPRDAGARPIPVRPLLDTLAQWGYPRETVTVEGDPATRCQATLTYCPMLDAAKRHPDVVCGIHLGLVRGTLEELGVQDPQVRVAPMVSPGVCAVEMSTPAADEQVEDGLDLSNLPGYH